MKLPRVLHDDTVTIVETTESETPDADGVPTATEVEHDWKNVNVQQLDTIELTDDRRTTITNYRVAGPPPPVTIDDGDTIRWNGLTCHVVGAPDNHRGRHRIAHTALTMRHTTG